jgi:integrase
VASVEKRKNGRTGYVVRWRDEQGKQRKKSFAKKTDADRYRAEVQHSLHNGTYIDPASGRQTFYEYAERWRQAQPHRPNTASRTKSQLHRHTYPAIGHRPVAAIRESELQAFVTGLDLAPSSVRPLWATVRAIFGAAYRDRIIGHDPTLGVKQPELPFEEITPLSTEQVDALAAAVPARFRNLIETDAGTGLRQGEAFAIEVSHIDFLRRTAKIVQQVQPAAGGEVVVCPLKNKFSYRSIPLGHAVVDGLAAHLAKFPAREVEVLDTTGKRPVRRMARFVFAYEDGKPLQRTDFNHRIWRPARDAVGLDGATMHDLRHHFASILISGGLNPKAVAGLLGHKDAAMTLRVYAHLWPNDDDRARDAVDAAFRRDVPHRDVPHRDVPHLRPAQ